jgi:hypothetical protein
MGMNSSQVLLSQHISPLLFIFIKLLFLSPNAHPRGGCHLHFAIGYNAGQKQWDYRHLPVDNSLIIMHNCLGNLINPERQSGTVGVFGICPWTQDQFANTGRRKHQCASAAPGVTPLHEDSRGSSWIVCGAAWSRHPALAIGGASWTLTLISTSSTRPQLEEAVLNGLFP